MFSRKHNRRKSEINNRLHVILAIILLLIGALVYRLYDIQLLKHDLYIALASDQHQVSERLEPKRGRIFIQDSKEENENLYPFAINKEFALIYAVPSKVENPKETAEKLFEIFDYTNVEKQVEEELAEDEYFKLNEQLNEVKLDPERQEFYNVKKELEIENRREIIEEGYLKILTKKNDPYEPLRKKVGEEVLNSVIGLNNPGLGYIMEAYRYYPEGNIGSHVIGFLGFNNDDKVGQYGLEGFFNEELHGEPGSIRTERSAGGEPIIINDREYNQPRDGSDLITTINRSIELFACKSLNKSAERHGAEGGSIIVMDPYSGAIIAMCSYPDYDPNNYNEVENITLFNNPAIFSDFEPGSIFKTITMAAAIDTDSVTPQTIYHDQGQVTVEGWPKPIKNSDFETNGGHGWVNMITVLEESLNTGAIFAMEKTGAYTFAEYVKNFGFGEKTGIEMETEGSGDIRNLERKTIRPVEAATASFGQGITATSLQLITAYAAIANGGILNKPYLVSDIRFPNGENQKTQPKEIRRVISQRSAMFLSGMLVNVIESGHAKKAAVKGYFIGGKTGTAQVAEKDKKGYSDRTTHSFIGFGPVDDPKFVMLIKLDNPKSVQFAADSAAPLFGEIAEFILNYYEVPKER